MINRSIAIVTPKKPMLEWSRRVAEDPGAISADGISEPGLYLLPDYNSENDKQSIIELFYDQIFTNELSWQNADESLWPGQRNRSLFDDWFEISLSNTILDLVDQPLDAEDQLD